MLRNTISVALLVGLVGVLVVRAPRIVIAQAVEQVSPYRQIEVTITGVCQSPVEAAIPIVGQVIASPFGVGTTDSDGKVVLLAMTGATIRSLPGLGTICRIDTDTITQCTAKVPAGLC